MGTHGLGPPPVGVALGKGDLGPSHQAGHGDPELDIRGSGAQLLVEPDERSVVLHLRLTHKRGGKLRLRAVRVGESQLPRDPSDGIRRVQFAEQPGEELPASLV